MKHNNFGLKMVHMLKMIFFFLEKPLIWDSCNSWLVLLYRISKKPLEWIQSYDDAAFWAQNGVFSSNENFFRKTINIVSMYILATLSVQNFKKVLRVGQKLWGCTILRPKMARLPRKRTFLENTLVNLVAFIYVHLHAKS